MVDQARVAVGVREGQRVGKDDGSTEQKLGYKAVVVVLLLT
jgi:hypothetical protein